MKNSAKYLLFLLLFCGATSCEHSCRGGVPPLETYGFRNQCGHTVSIVLKPSCVELPDSLVLLDGEEFRFFDKNDPDRHGPSIFSAAKMFDSQVIYYDGRYVIKFKDLPAEQKIQWSRSYNWESITTYANTWFYIFTEKDYQYAVEKGMDLEAGK